MPGDDRPRQAGDRIESLLDALGAGGAVARGRAEELVRQVTDLYGSGLARILEILDNRGQLDDATLDALTADELVSSLLVIHGLHPQDLETRVTAALDSVRPYLGSHGGNVELLDVSPEGVVRLRLLGTCQGCPSSSVTLKFAVEEAIESAAPEVTDIQVVEEEARAATPAVIPVDALLVRLNHPAHAGPDSAGPDSGGTDSAGAGTVDGGTPGGAGTVPSPGSPGHWQEHAPGSWEAVPGIAGLEQGEVAGFMVAGYPVLACRTGQDLYAYRDYCPRCTGSMAGASLQRALAGAVGGGLLRCPACRAHFDVRQAGSCLEDRTLHLDPLPLLVRAGVMSVAVPLVSSQDA